MKHTIHHSLFASIFMVFSLYGNSGAQGLRSWQSYKVPIVETVTLCALGACYVNSYLWAAGCLENECNQAASQVASIVSLGMFGQIIATQRKKLHNIPQLMSGGALALLAYQHYGIQEGS